MVTGKARVQLKLPNTRPLPAPPPQLPSERGGPQACLPLLHPRTPAAPAPTGPSLPRWFFQFSQLLPSESGKPCSF